ncbi:MAG: hypothetical protein QG622_1022 [Actinomycetota bacterium]|nr:hypothetical protein [Actinomycetota bacterium]
MNDAFRPGRGPDPIVLRLPRRVRLAAGVFALVTSMTATTAWAVGASADTGSTGAPTPARGVSPTTRPVSSPAASSPSGSVSTRTSYRWTFEDGLPGGWYGRSAGSAPSPWLTPSAAAAAAGDKGLLVGAVTERGSGVSVDVSRALVAPGTYTATARVRLPAGQADTAFEISGPPQRMGTGVTDAGWTTLTGVVAVRADGSVTPLTIGPGDGYCLAPNRGDFAPAPGFHLDEVALTRSDGVTPIGTVTTPTTGTDCPTYTQLPPATVKIHYEVTSADAAGFSATVVLTNLKKTSITDWVLPMSPHCGEWKPTWISGAKAIMDPTTNCLRSLIVGDGATATIPAGGQVRFSLGMPGSPVGSAGLFTSMRGEFTGRN